MTAEEHNKTLATLYFVYSAIHGLTLAGLLLLILIVRLGSPVSFSIPGVWIAVGAAAILIVLVAIVLLPLAAGFGLRKRKGWAKPLTMAAAVASLLNIPIGTALGIYSIKFFRSGAGAALYGGAVATGETELQEALQANKKLGALADRLQ